MRWTLLLCSLWMLPSSVGSAAQLRVATFEASVTPPIGVPVAYATTRSITDPLSARGVVILSDQKPIVLCAVDWLGIANEGMDLWRAKIAEAAGTDVNRVAVHALHQHDGARGDISSAKIMQQYQIKNSPYDEAFIRHCVQNVAMAVKDSLTDAQPVTHLGVGSATVEKIASNRRLLGDDGKVKLMRWSKSTNPTAINAPEGVVDPELKLVSFWNDETPIASLTYYATHPQSYYGQGDVTSEFVGIARSIQEKAVPKVAHVHFNGASGNVAAGKYNDGSVKMRKVMADRLGKAMATAWANQKKQAITTKQLEWRVESVSLPLGKHLIEENLIAILENPKSTLVAARTAAKHLAWLRRTKAGHKMDLSCLWLDDVALVQMPGELFIEYQLAAQKMRPDATVCMAAYGEYGPGYIGTAIAYTQGGYEVSPGASRVAPESEAILLAALKKLLK